MSRRNQGRRRRAYAKRQHEVRERRPSQPVEQPDWADDVDGRQHEPAEARGLVGTRWAELFEARHGGRAAA